MIRYASLRPTKKKRKKITQHTNGSLTSLSAFEALTLMLIALECFVRLQSRVSLVNNDTKGRMNNGNTRGKGMERRIGFSTCDFET